MIDSHGPIPNSTFRLHTVTESSDLFLCYDSISLNNNYMSAFLF